MNGHCSQGVVHAAGRSSNHRVGGAQSRLVLTAGLCPCRLCPQVRAVALLLVAAPLALLPVTVLAQPSLPYMDLPEETRGKDIIMALGDKLDDVAAAYGMSPLELRELVIQDNDVVADARGRLLYACEMLAVNSSSSAVADELNSHRHARDEPYSAVTSKRRRLAQTIPTSQAFLLHSRPAGATKVRCLSDQSRAVSDT